MSYLFGLTFGLCLCILAVIVAMLSSDDYSLFQKINDSIRKQAIALILFAMGCSFVIMGIINLVGEYYRLLDK